MKYSFLLASALFLFACGQKSTEKKTSTEASTETTTEATSPKDSSVSKTLVAHLEILNIETGARQEVYNSTTHFEAPNWTSDGKYLVFNSLGKLYKIAVEKGSQPIEINSDFATDCNNDHLLSPDGKQIAISHHIKENHDSKIYVLPFEGGTPQLVTPKGPSYLHGWSPDGKRLAYCADRDGDYNVFTIGVNGGEEIQLTDSKGLDDGPEYSPDGKYIYFNSVRTGTMQIWRMKPDGSEETQITFDDKNDWFAHPSPDNTKLVFVSYDKSVPAGSHPPNKDVEIRMLKIGEKEPTTLLPLFGGQGTMNVPSWSADSKRIAFVRYEFI